MPEYPDTDLLQTLIQRQTQPRPATGNPSIDRAMQAMDKINPQAHSTVAEPDWSPWMYTNIMGRMIEDDPHRIQVNAIHAATSPQPDIERTVAHEMEHVKQYANDPQPKLEGPTDVPKLIAWAQRHSMREPYEKRPEEIAAFKAGDEYIKNRKPVPDRDYINPDASYGFYDAMNRSPIVQSLIDRLNHK